MKKWMILACLAALLAMLCAASLADGLTQWVYSEIHGYIPLAAYVGEYDGYRNVDGLGGITAADPYYLQVISKSASVWEEPRTNSKKLASVSHGDSLLCRTANGGDVIMENGFYAVEYMSGKKNSEWKPGWVNADYVVRNALEIILLESNVPAYIAPDTTSKKVGSLAKMTRHHVIGMYDDFYIINLRGAAAAFIPMSVKHYDTTFVALHRQSIRHDGVALRKTALRIGPGESYAQADTLKTGEEFTCIDLIDGWYLLADHEASVDSGVYLYVDAEDVRVNTL